MKEIAVVFLVLCKIYIFVVIIDVLNIILVLLYGNSSQSKHIPSAPGLRPMSITTSPLVIFLFLCHFLLLELGFTENVSFGGILWGRPLHLFQTSFMSLKSPFRLLFSGIADDSAALEVLTGHFSIIFL